MGYLIQGEPKRLQHQPKVESRNRSFGLRVINLYEAPVNYAPTDLTAPNGLVVKQRDSVGSVIGQFQVFDLNDSGINNLFVSLIHC